MTERSRGSVLLARTCKTQDEVATSIGVSRVAVSNWLNGHAKPGAKKRAMLRAKYGVEESSWDEPVARKTKGRTAPSPPPPRVEVPDGVIAKAKALEQMAHDLMTKMQNDSDATPLEKARVMNAIASTLNLLARMTGQFDLGNRLFQLPIWKQIVRALETGLEGHPKAAEAVARELRKVDAGYAAS